MPEPLKILFLEDNPHDADMVKRVLQKEPIEAAYYPAMTREEFLNGLDNFQPDLILSDNSMPQFSATEALALFRQRSLLIPFILITGTVSEEFAAGIIKLGADDFILKDRLARLPFAIENALKQKRTERENRDAMRRLQESEENLRTIFDNTSQGFILVDGDYMIKAYNANGKKYAFFNSQRNVETGLSIWNYFSAPQAAEVVSLFQKVGEGETIDFDYRHPDNEKNLWLHFTINPVHKEKGIDGLCITATDISERKQAAAATAKLEEEMMAQKLAEQKKITRAVMRAEEKERNHMGRELHDNVNQILAGAKLYFGNVGRDEPSLVKLMEYPVKLVDMCISEIRQLSKRTVIPIRDINLVQVMETLLESVATNSGLRTEFVYNVTSVLSDELKLNIYRILQEIISNTIKHAGAKNICVIIEEHPQAIRVNFTDDGKGFDLKQKRNGIGLSNIKNRAESFNGTLQLVSAPGEGCQTTITIPI